MLRVPSSGASKFPPRQDLSQTHTSQAKGPSSPMPLPTPGLGHNPQGWAALCPVLSCFHLQVTKCPGSATQLAACPSPASAASSAPATLWQHLFVLSRAGCSAEQDLKFFQCLEPFCSWILGWRSFRDSGTRNCRKCHSPWRGQEILTEGGNNNTAWDWGASGACSRGWESSKPPAALFVLPLAQGRLSQPWESSWTICQLPVQVLGSIQASVHS